MYVVCDLPNKQVLPWKFCMGQHYQDFDFFDFGSEHFLYLDTRLVFKMTHDKMNIL